MFIVKKSVYGKKPNERAYKKTNSLLYHNKSMREVCEDQYNYFEKFKRNKTRVSYSNFGTKRTSITTLSNGGKIKTIIEEVLVRK
jgi:hypothetical protein